jgi:protoporphyrinogen/coproporphyrinogen III oxidase
VKVAVVGGGISGLAAAWELVTGPTGAEVTVLEPGRPGGRIETIDFCGHRVDTGPDAFIARVPDGLRLVQELGLEAEEVAPSAGRALLWAGGRCRPLPEGLVLGAPARLLPLLSSRILSPAGILRAALDLVMPPTTWAGDTSVSAVVSRRFGRQVAERLVDPLLGGIHAGSTEELSVEAVAPQLAEAARRHRSLFMALRQMPSPPAGPVFLALRGGMARLVDRLVEALTDKGVCFQPVHASAVKGERGGGVIIDPVGAFDAAVLATPAAATAQLLQASAHDAATGLRGIGTASVVLSLFAYPRSAIDVPPGTSGMLVPRGSGLLMTACSFGSAKWPHWSNPDTMVLRVSAGRFGDRGALDLPDDVLIERLHAELEDTLGVASTPSAHRVTRWEGAFPQYTVGHLDRVARIESSLKRSLSRVTLAGASLRGSGLPACVASGRRAASMLAESMSGET